MENPNQSQKDKSSNEKLKDCSIKDINKKRQTDRKSINDISERLNLDFSKIFEKKK